MKNWSADPLIRGAYSIDFDGSQDAIVRDIAAPIDGRVYFSGEALSIDNQATVPGAMQSAYAAVRNLLRDEQPALRLVSWRRRLPFCWPQHNKQ